jgi:hypothetical protein
MTIHTYVHQLKNSVVTTLTTSYSNAIMNVENKEAVNLFIISVCWRILGRKTVVQVQVILTFSHS